MRWLGLVLILLALNTAQAFAEAEETPNGARIVAPSIDPGASCKVCHADVVRLRDAVSEEDPHEGIDCDECHLGRRFNPHLPPELDGTALAIIETTGGYCEDSPELIAGCADCHEDEKDEWRESIHGAGPTTDEGVERPGCVDCHGSLHAATTPIAAKRETADRCIACHDFEPEEEKGPASPYVVDTFRETIHGKMIALGNEEAAGCADCHTGHRVFAADDPRSTVHPDNRTETCRECHENATESFTAAISHRPHTIDADFWSWLVALAFSVLTVGTVVMLLVHVLLDLYHAGRKIFETGSGEEHGSDEVPLAADDQVQRLDAHLRLQHVIMIVSFVTLVITGWPLKSAAVGVSSGLARALGGPETLALIHRIAGSLMIFVAFYHVAYLGIRWRRGELGVSMIPGARDASDFAGNILYYLGVRKERPKFDTFTYYEKFDYWAIFWGVPIMVGTGLILWFPELTARVLPGDFIVLAYIAHSDEALLALLAIFLWHFYNQHLRPSVFPMSWVWITGRITAEALYDEHRAAYEREYGDGPPRAPVNSPSWNEHPVWSFAALFVVLFAAVFVLALDVSSIRSRLVALEPHPEAAGTIAMTAGPRDVVSAFDEGFDQWDTCFACHNEARFESNEEHFPHKVHFEDEEIDDECTNCHESIIHEKFTTDRESCLECHDPDEIGLLEEAAS